MALPVGLPTATAQAGIAECRQAMTAAKIVYEQMLIAQERYERLGLGSVEDGDFSDDLPATDFTTTMSNLETLIAAFSDGIRTNLNKAGL